MKGLYTLVLLGCCVIANAQYQLEWRLIDSAFAPLPKSVHVYTTTTPLDGKPNHAYYIIADLKDKALTFTVDTSYKRGLTPDAFFAKHNQPHRKAFVIVNATFFNMKTYANLNAVMLDGKLIGWNHHNYAGKKQDSGFYLHPAKAALGLTAKRKADIAWTYTDTSYPYIVAMQQPLDPLKDKRWYTNVNYWRNKNAARVNDYTIPADKRWKKMETVIGGGPVLVQDGRMLVTNNEEMAFAGKALYDKHPRTAIGYTYDNKLIILVVEGRNAGIAEGADLQQLANMMLQLGCKEAMNLDGGGSTCMLVNGKPTIKVSDKEGQRAVPAVFMIQGSW